VLPIYIAGRSRTGVSPSRTVIWDASYGSVKKNLRKKMIKIRYWYHNNYWLSEDLKDKA